MMVSIEQAIEDIKNGKMLVVVDDEDRENEGDIVFAGAFCTEEKVNFAITHAKGLVCTPVSKEIANKLGFIPMVANNTSAHETAFTISVDGKDTTTGISAYERDMTIKLIANFTSKPDDFVKPGHIFPLIAKDGGVLERTGHTEGSIDLCKFAGLAPVAVICEIIKEDGAMARRDDLDIFCKKHNLNMISIEEIVKYRLKNENLVKFSQKMSGEIAGSSCEFYEVKDHRDSVHKVFVFGDIKEVTNVKFHKIGFDDELLTSNKFNNFMNCIKYLKDNGGILILMKSNTNDEKDIIKEYGIGAQILNHLGVKSINLLSLSEAKEFVGIKGFGLDIKENILL